MAVKSVSIFLFLLFLQVEQSVTGMTGQHSFCSTSDTLPILYEISSPSGSEEIIWSYQGVLGEL